jgi:hypothetical protein
MYIYVSEVRRGWSGGVFREILLNVCCYMYYCMNGSPALE